MRKIDHKVLLFFVSIFTAKAHAMMDDGVFMRDNAILNLLALDVFEGDFRVAGDLGVEKVIHAMNDHTFIWIGHPCQQSLSTCRIWYI